MGFILFIFGILVGAAVWSVPAAIIELFTRGNRK